MTVWRLFDHFSRISPAFPPPPPRISQRHLIPHTPCDMIHLVPVFLSDADWCSQSDVVANSRLQAASKSGGCVTVTIPDSRRLRIRRSARKKLLSALRYIVIIILGEQRRDHTCAGLASGLGHQG